MNDPKDARDWWSDGPLPKFCRPCGSELEEASLIGLFDPHTGQQQRVTVLDCPKFQPLQYYPVHDRWYVDEPLYLTYTYK
jgi:hypothetical protein